jgi:hypothetical protein
MAGSLGYAMIVTLAFDSRQAHQLLCNISKAMTVQLF